MRPAVIVVYSCLHTGMFTVAPPAEGDMVWCGKCGDYKEVATSPHDFTVDCVSCVYRRMMGNALISAETMATKHAMKYAGHRVRLLDGGALVREFSHPVIHVDVTVPPF